MCKHFFENVASAVVPGYGEAKAADKQVAGIEQGVNKLGEIWDYNRGNIAPWMEGGRNAFDRYNMALFGGPSSNVVEQPVAGSMGSPTVGAQQPSYGGFQQSPGYNFAFDEGMRAVNNAFGARGMLNSGARMKALTRYGQGLANQEFQGYLDNAFRSAGIGANALGLNTQTGSDYASNFANAWQNKGAAQASRYAGVANAWGDLRGAGVDWLTGKIKGIGGGGTPPATPDIYGGYDPTNLGI